MALAMGLSCTKRTDIVTITNKNSGTASVNTNRNAKGIYTSPDTEKHQDNQLQLVTNNSSDLTQTKVDATEVSHVETVDRCWSIISKQIQPPRKCETSQRNFGWKTVRLFVSSTFNDFFYEREILVKKVFPELREWCEERKLYLLECDLRWGVPRDSTTRDTISTCLEEIDRCRDDNDNQPFFLNMISHRYGWVPDVGDIPEDIINNYLWVPGVSITTMENLHGVYRCNNPNALIFLRNADFLEKIPPEVHPQYCDASNLAQLQLKTLKEKLSDKFPHQVYEYSCDVVEGENSTPESPQVMIEGLGEFARISLEFFQSAIERMYPYQSDQTSLTEHELEDALQRLFVEQKSERFVGRQEELNLLMNYGRGVAMDRLEQLDGNEERHYKRDVVEGGNLIALLDGDPGSGKTALLSKFTGLATQVGLDVFYHFVGVSPNSFSAYFMLQRLLTALLKTAQSETAIPEDFTALSELFAKTLQSPELQDKQLLVIIDGIDEMLVRETVGSLSWFPASLPGHIRFIVSLGDDLTARSFLQDSPTFKVTLGQLSDAEIQEIIELNLARFNKRLDPEQLQLLMTKPGCTSPLWIDTVCEELRVFGRFEKVTERVTSLPDTLHGLLGEIIERLLSEDETKCMEKALCLINFCLQGFPLSECLPLLGDGDTPAPLMDWAKVRRLLKPYLRTVVVKNQERVFFFHKAMQTAVVEKLVPEGEEQKWYEYLLDYLETRCDNTDLIRTEILDYYTQAKLIDRMVQFVRTNKKAESLSEHHIRMHLQRFRCYASINTPASVSLGLCMSCGMRRGAFSTRHHTNPNICIICAKWIPSNFPFGEAKLCMSHAIRTGHPAGMNKCYACRMPVAGKVTPVKLCQQCSFGLQRCCHVGAR